MGHGEMSRAITTTKSPRAVPYIPIEVARVIAREIDVQSARSLARTCKALRDIGELAIWRVLDITNDWYESLDTIQADLEALDPAPYRAGAAAIDSRVKHTLVAFATYPFRMACVTSVRVEPSDGADAVRSTELLRLLTPLLPRIRRFEILPRPFSPSVSTSEPYLHHDHFFAGLNHLPNAAYTHITHLKYTYLNGDGPLVPEFVRHLRNLQELEVCCSRHTASACVAETGGMEPFPHLRRITFEQLDLPRVGKTIDILAMLLELAPNLEFFRFRGKWNPQRHHRALKAISQAKRLKTVVFSDSIGTPKPVMAAPSGTTFRNLGRLGLAAREAVVEMEELEEGQELSFELLRFPAADHLRKMTILSCARPSLPDYTDLGIGPTPEPTRPIPGYFLHRLSLAKLLSHILLHHLESYFPSPYSSNFVEPEYFVATKEWAGGGYRGLVIRQYLRPYLDEEHDHPLWHIRVLSRSVLSPSGQPYIGTKRVWQDFTSYRGRIVPRSVLRAVYEAAGLELESVKEGRDLDLGQGHSAWEILDKWRDAAGPGKNDEGDYPSAWGNSDDEASETQSSEGGEDGGQQHMMGPHLDADGVYEDDDGVFDEDEYSDHEPYWGYDQYEEDEDDEDDDLF